MPRGQDLLDEAMNLVSGANVGDSDVKDRAEAMADRLKRQRDKFFFKSLAGVPLANKVKKACQALGETCSSDNLDAVEALVTEIENKADAPGTVLT